MAAMDVLIKKRAVIKSKLTRFQNWVDTISNSLDDKAVSQLPARLAAINPLLEEFENLQLEIELSQEGEDQVAANERDRESFETTYFGYISIANDLIEKTSIKQPAPTTPQRGNSGVSSEGIVNHVKLPTINLPTFSGEYHNWLEYRDTFFSLINSNEAINNTQKFHYLKASLKGEASSVIYSLQLSDANYAVAWNALVERYDNKRLIVHNHVKSLFELPSLHKESHTLLRQLVDGISKNLRSLKALGQPADSWDTLLIYIISSKLDSITSREWESQKISGEFPTMDEFIKFLKSRCELLEKLNFPSLNSSNSNKFGPQKAKYSSNALATTLHPSTAEKQTSCGFCKEAHSILECPEFKKLSVESRIAETKSRRLCINCLKGNHFYKVCRSSRCRICNRKHNTLLHLRIPTNTVSEVVQAGSSSENKAPESQTISTIVNHALVNHPRDILLSTAIVRIQDNIGNLQDCRVLLDSGSQSNFITQELANRLALKKVAINFKVVGIGNIATGITHTVEVKLNSNFNNYHCTIRCLVVPQITGNVPTCKFDMTELKIPQNIKLADNSPNTPRRIDLLIGAEIFYSSLCAGQIGLGKRGLVMQKTKFGWVLGGPLDPIFHPSSDNMCNLAASCDNCDRELHNQVANFWQVEECSEVRSFSQDEKLCEEHFLKSFKRQADGRFVVSIPLKDSLKKLGNSEELAISRFSSLERKLSKNAEFKQQYIKFMREYEAMGHMTKVDQNHNSINYYLPHHGVVKADSLTTKLRVVFDGSAKTTSGVSLNDLQLVGPVLQDDLFTILLRFREHRYVISADVAKMYRQVMIKSEQRELQRIVWREDPSNSLSHYTLNTVTYGTTAASYLAVRCLQQLAHEFKQKFPLSSEVILRDFYVDDLLSGSNTIEDAIKMRDEITAILKDGCFELRKWVSNEPSILEGIQNLSEASVLSFGAQENIKTLGLIWLPQQDNISYSIDDIKLENNVSKRQILSVVAKIFDPLGLVSPSIIIPKIILQKLWQYKLSWDESIPLDLHTQWLKFKNDLNALGSIKIPRRVLITEPIAIELHGFADSSLVAYGACVYIKSGNNSGAVSISLLCAKSRVAPIKSVSIPRLELCAALLLARLVAKVTQAVRMKLETVNYWSDSMVTLAWIKASPSNLKPFVANRVAEIQELTSQGKWRYVPSEDNPADIISRGIEPNGLAKSKLWWNGPSWLCKSKNSWPVDHACNSDSPQYLNEIRQQTLSNPATVIKNDFNLFQRFSSLTKLKRCVAYCLRFKYNASKSRQNRNLKNLSLSELNNSLRVLVKVAQNEVFDKDINDLIRNKTVGSRGRLSPLSPFVDEEGILRVGGRFMNSNFNQNKKHPCVLPANHHFTYLIIKHEHHQMLHAGPQAVLASVRESYWPISGRNMAKKVVRECVTCFKVNPQGINPPMGSLPRERVTASFPFSVSGIDYCGPILIKNRKGRGSKSIKSYICVFVCFSTKAMHLELVSDLTTEVFVAAFKRFIARRGKPSKVYSDNGTNFVGADREFKNFLKALGKQPNKSEFENEMLSEGVTWSFIAPRSPHLGGLWEAGVKSVKFHLKRVVGNALLTFEELNTVLTQIEAAVNSRPLTPLSTDPNDPHPLTPAHFLIGRTFAAMPEADISDVKDSRLSRFEHCQKIFQHFWRRWSKEYLGELQKLAKWHNRNQRSIKRGMLVLIKEDNTPPLKWHMGRVVDVYEGSDGIVRVASVKTISGTYKRSVTKLCPLPE